MTHRKMPVTEQDSRPEVPVGGTRCPTYPLVLGARPLSTRFGTLRSLDLPSLSQPAKDLNRLLRPFVRDEKVVMVVASDDIAGDVGLGESR